MTLTRTTTALNTELVTLADLKVAIEPGDSDDTFLSSLIGQARDHFQREFRRVFGREVLT